MLASHLPPCSLSTHQISSRPTGKWDPGDAIDHIPRPGIQSAGGCFTEKLQRDSEAATQPGACTNGTQLTRTPTGVEG